MKNNYTIINGDVIEQLSQIPNYSVSAIITDPPYAVNINAKWDVFDTNKQYQDWCYQWGTECFRVLKPGGSILAFCGARTYHRLACGLEDAGFITRDMLEWIYWASFAKGKNLKPGHEPIYYGIKPPVESITFNVDACRIPMSNKQHNAIEQWLLENQPIKPRADIWTKGNRCVGKEYNSVVGKKEKGWKHTTNPPHPRGRVPYNVITSYNIQAPNFIDIKKPRGQECIPGHPTQKPLKLINWLIMLVTNERDVIVDPFAGSGTTGEAAINVSRNIILIEKQPEYIQIMEERMSNMTTVHDTKCYSI